MEQNTLDKNKEHILSIIAAMNQNPSDQRLVTQALISYGAYLQKNHPDSGLDEIRKIYSKQELGFDDAPLPDMSDFGALSEARITEYQRVLSSEPPDKQQIYKLDALQKGLNLFAVALGEERIDVELSSVADKLDFDLDILPMCDVIRDIDYEIDPLIAEIERKNILSLNLIYELSTLNEHTMSELKNVISQELDKLREMNPGFWEDENSNIENFIKDVVENKKQIPPEHSGLKDNCLSYAAILELDKSLSESGKPHEKLSRFHRKLEEPNIQQALSANTDTTTKKFIKTATYIAASIVTFGIYHAIKKGEPLRSKQQCLLRESIKKMKKADNDSLMSDEISKKYK
jgi:hypothetical protein